MNDTVEVIMILSPEEPPIPEGPDYVDLAYTQVTAYTTEGSQYSTAYGWSLDPSDAGVIEITSLTESEVSWNSDFLGDAFVSVKGINECGESEWSEGLQVTVDNTVGFSQFSKDIKIRILPNPNTGSFILRIRSEQLVNLNLFIFNSLKELVYNVNNIHIYKEYSKIIDLGTLPNGLYFFQGETTDSIFLKKIIIQK
jgi:hypothetical protein